MSGPAKASSPRFVVPPKTAHDQRRAANPASSAWVSANAGSGKTKVLADRVLRLLLAGTNPARILCLTFTKAAAANMSIRVFDELGAWVTLSDGELAHRLQKLDGSSLNGPERLERARRLFAHAVETPGGLRIETIHAFCERLLHQFPFEANVPARFEVLDETQAQDLLDRASREVMAAAAMGRDATLAAALTHMANEAADSTVLDVLQAALRHKPFLREHARGPEGLARALAAFGALCGLGPHDSTENLQRQVLEEGIPPAEWLAMAAELAEGRATDIRRADALRQAAGAEEIAERFALYCGVYLKNDGEPYADRAFVTKSIRPDLAERLKSERERVAGFIPRLKAAATIRRTQALFTLADAVFGRVEAIKNARGALDFDDLIGRAVSLLQRADAAWVLYKLDAGIDHVLVDEAQDTSPQQWLILKALVEEFTAGDGAFPRRRTLFAVGDPKQSIYGFQGAAPREFETSGRYFRTRAEAAGLPFESVELTVSFRSAPEILSAVDAVFALPNHRKGLSFDEDVPPVHESARPHAPGLVEVWETVRPETAADPDAWSAPLDEPEASAPSVRLARQVARTISQWMRTGDENGTIISPGDVLVLVRKRGPFFEAVIRALKDARVPVAGADRLTVADHIAVRDLVAAARAALLPQDDLTLAAALKSPLAGLDDDDLIRIAARRGEGLSLLAALRQAAHEGDAVAQKAVAAFEVWRTMAERKGPFGFYAALLGPQGGRRALVSRLGAEAGDAIDAFLALALDHERREPPSLGGFLNAFEGATRDVKRDMDAASAEVRVMTIHGAKGLEAPVVILADGLEVPSGRHDPKLIPVSVTLDGKTFDMPVWSPRRDADPAPVTERRAEIQVAAAEEANRLLYVALTRAKDRLVVASFSNSGRDKDGNLRDLPDMGWTSMIRSGLQAAKDGVSGQGARLVESTLPNGTVRWLWSTPARQAEPFEAPAKEEQLVEAAPDWLFRMADATPETLPPLRPSNALSAADREGALDAWQPETAAMASARQRGQFVHALLERLPALRPEVREQAARRFLEVRATGLPADQCDNILESVFGVLALPQLAALFGADSRAEVALAGELIAGQGQSGRIPVTGQIDRLAFTDDAIYVADFKTGSRLPVDAASAPQSHVVQLAIYRELLRQIAPERPLRAFLIYTAGPLVLEMPPDLLDKSLRSLRVFTGPA